MLEDITPDASLTRIEEEVRRFWRRHKVPEASRAARRRGAPYVIYLQPLRVAGRSWSDQLRLLATADLMARYRTMRGDAVHCQTGWACHGLPVEMAVEGSLGPTVAGFDLAQFNAACRQVSLEGIQQGENLAERLGVWLDPETTYQTMSPQAVGLVWRALWRLWKDGRLKQERRVVAFCPRCATPLSSSQTALKTVQSQGTAVWLCLPWDGEPNAYFLVWAQAPWMLPGMVALAAHPDTTYALVEPLANQDQPGIRLLLSEAALEQNLIGNYRVIRRLAGKSLRGAGYRPPFTFLPSSEVANCLVLSESVPGDRGTGLLPVTPAFEAWSLDVTEKHNLQVPQLLDDWGNLDDRVAPWRGLSPLDAEPLIVENLAMRGLLYRQEPVTRSSALCPYCDTALLPLTRTVWLAETAAGPWILGRDRAWGAPLPIWVCQDCGATLCLAGLDDLAHRLGLETQDIDPHRPAIDRLVLSCESCGRVMRRVPDVIDDMFEAAVLPWATARRPGPADLAVGIGDRHLGWLGDLTEVAALLRGSLAWERAVAVSKAELETNFDGTHSWPGDVMRWAACTDTDLGCAEPEFLRPLWRSFVCSRAQVEGQLPADPQRRVPASSSETAGLFDRWLWARLNQGIQAISAGLDACELRRAAGDLVSLLADVSEWYIPHRLAVPVEVYHTLSRLLAPFVPHLAEAIYREVEGQGETSVHLAAWPDPDPSRDDASLLVQMALVQRLASLASSARAAADISPDTMLVRAIVDMGEDPRAQELSALHDFLAEVLHVLEVQFIHDAADKVDWSLTLDREWTVHRRQPAEEIASALAELSRHEASWLASQLRRGLSISLEVAGQSITLLPDEVRLSALPQVGWAAAADSEYIVLLQ
jgi:isoleucyl-tRNA synthetase